VDQNPDLDPSTVLINAGRAASGNSLAPALWATSAFVTPGVDAARQMATSTGATEFYSRYGNPTVADFESLIAELEGAEAARAFASGMGAISAVVLGICSKGDHVVTQRQLYAGTQLLFNAICPRFGIDVTFVDATDPDEWEAAVIPGRTTLVFAESPANPKLDLVDLARLGGIAGPVTAVDSTFATPLGQRPLEAGVDLVVHSATKAIGGHNDATIGAVAGSRELIDWLYGFAVLQGANASPSDALNALRGARTLAVRLERQTATAGQLAAFLEADPRVAGVWYPGLDSFPQRELARRQLTMNGGLITFDLAGGAEAGRAFVAGGAEAGRAFVEATRLCRLATSLGGPETLVTHPASTTHVGLLPEELEASGIGAGTIRMSVGLEDAGDLIADLRAALDMTR